MFQKRIQKKIQIYMILKQFYIFLYFCSNHGNISIGDEGIWDCFGNKGESDCGFGGGSNLWNLWGINQVVKSEGLESSGQLLEN